MIKTIKTEDVKIGMFVVLPQGVFSWIKHPFLKSNFLVENESLRQELLSSGIKTVSIDTARSKVLHDAKSILLPELIEPVPIGWNPKKNISKSLTSIINNPSMSAQEKAQKVYEDSLCLMYNLFQSPTVEKIVENKKTIFQIVDFILADDTTSMNLLKLLNHDRYTYTHSVNVGVLSVSLAKRLYGKDPKIDMHELGAGFFLHDLGKLTIDSAILNKPGPLDAEEMGRIRTHPWKSFQILQNAGHLSPECGIIAMQHHEREDGTGYPKRLKGDEISDYAQICCIADVFDALTSERSYKKAKTTFEALQIMKEQMTGHFNKEIFEKFFLLFIRF